MPILIPHPKLRHHIVSNSIFFFRDGHLQTFNYTENLQFADPNIFAQQTMQILLQSYQNGVCLLLLASEIFRWLKFTYSINHSMDNRECDYHSITSISDTLNGFSVRYLLGWLELDSSCHAVDLQASLSLINTCIYWVIIHILWKSYCGIHWYICLKALIQHP